MKAGQRVLNTLPHRICVSSLLPQEIIQSPMIAGRPQAT
jgi:hypothetical protein